MCAIAVWYAAHRVAVLMALEQRTESDSVDGVTFFVHSAPALAIGVVANVAWIGKLILDLCRRRGLAALPWLGAAIGIWGAAIVAARLF
jgi:hypothetical protein